MSVNGKRGNSMTDESEESYVRGDESGDDGCRKEWRTGGCGPAAPGAAAAGAPGAAAAGAPGAAGAAAGPLAAAGAAAGAGPTSRAALRPRPRLWVPATTR